MNHVYTLIYASSAKWRLEEIELEHILSRARMNNEQAGITGMLLYAEGNFLQILEGQREDVEILFDQINKDKRHHGIIKLMTLESSLRHFPDWSMGFQRINLQDLEHAVPGYNAFFHSPAQRQEIKDRVSNNVWKLLLSYRQIVNA